MPYVFAGFFGKQVSYSIFWLVLEEKPDIHPLGKEAEIITIVAI